MFKKLYLTVLMAVMLGTVSAHIEMIDPLPFRSKYNPAEKNPDYSMTTPLSTDGSDYPAKGYATPDAISSDSPTATLNAGSSYNVKLAGSATHGGGSCQWGLSYDGGKTIVVIHSAIGGCPLQTEYSIPIPADAPPADKALFFWTWQNKIGNREEYQNAALVKIVGSGSSSFSGPLMWRANSLPDGTCITKEGVSPVYPNPGPSVEYGGEYASSKPSDPTILDPCSLGAQDGEVTVSASITSTVSKMNTGVNSTSIIFNVPWATNATEWDPEGAPRPLKAQLCDSAPTKSEEPLPQSDAPHMSSPDATPPSSPVSSPTDAQNLQNVPSMSGSLSDIPTGSPSASAPSDENEYPASQSGILPNGSAVPSSSLPTNGTASLPTNNQNGLEASPAMSSSNDMSSGLATPSVTLPPPTDNNGSPSPAGEDPLPSDSSFSSASMPTPAPSNGSTEAPRSISDSPTDGTNKNNDNMEPAADCSTLSDQASQPQSNAAITGQSCEGEESSIKCDASGSSWYSCAQGAWVSRGPVPAGVTCKDGLMSASRNVRRFKIPRRELAEMSTPEYDEMEASDERRKKEEEESTPVSCKGGAEIKCSDDGQSWSLCDADNKSWVAMGSVPAGIRCVKGTRTSSTSSTYSKSSSMSSQSGSTSSEAGSPLPLSVSSSETLPTATPTLPTSSSPMTSKSSSESMSLTKESHELVSTRDQSSRRRKNRRQSRY